MKRKGKERKEFAEDKNPQSRRRMLGWWFGQQSEEKKLPKKQRDWLLG